MQDIIKQIVDMDRKARKITDAAQLEKVNSEKDISSKREQIRKNYLEKARKRISLNEPIEREAAEKEWKEKEKKYDELSIHLDEIYHKKGDEWVKAIVAKVIEE